MSVKKKVKDKNNEYNRIKFISEGAIGKVYLVTKNDKKYAMKIEYISGLNDIALKNELHFVEKVASKYPEQFMQLIDHKIIQNCIEDSPKIPDWFDEKEKEYFINLRKSKLCVKKIYTLVNTTLNKIPINKLKKAEIYSMLIQLLYINYLIQKNGFVHGDFHTGNIGVIKVSKKKKIKIFGRDIPSYGKQYVAIDYGGVLHKDTLSDKRKYQQHNCTELEHYNEHLLIDKLGLINNMVDFKNFWKFVNKNNITLNFENDLKLILSQPEIKLLEHISKHKYVLFDTFKLLFPVKFQKILLREKYRQKIPIITHIKSADILYAYSNIDDDKKLINYFITILEESN